MPLYLQYLIIAIAVLFSSWIVLKKQLPNVARKLRLKLAAFCLKQGRPMWLRRFGLRLTPAANSAADSCGKCNGCS